MKNILIVDDHPVVREGLKKVLMEKYSDYILHEADCGQSAIDMVSGSDYDLIMLDISMPGMNGMEALKAIKAIKPRIPVLILSIYREEHYALRTLKMGAKGYICKDSSMDDLLDAVGKITGGGCYISDRIAVEMVSGLDGGCGAMPHTLLSHRELQVMLMISSGATVNDIATRLSISVKTVSTYRTRLLKKMKMQNNAEITYYSIRHGLLV